MVDLALTKTICNYSDSNKLNSKEITHVKKDYKPPTPDTDATKIQKCNTSPEVLRRGSVWISPHSTLGL